MKNKVLQSIIKKEFIHIWKDPITLIIILLLPIIMMILFGYAITLDMRDIRTVIDDLSDTPESRMLVDRISSSGFFKVTQRTVPERDVDTIFQSKQARCIVIIPRDYARDLAHKLTTRIQVLIDASDPNAANFINNYLQQITYAYNQDINQRLPVPFTVVPRFIYNPDLRSTNFFVPGLFAIILLLISALLTSVAITREKELGTMEQILVSPVRPRQIIIGKVIPYLLIAFFSGLNILFMSRTLFAVPFEGSVIALLVMLVIYIFAGLSFGLLISTVAKSQSVAMIMAMMITMLPTIMLSGFIFPIESMPLVFRVISYIIPARHFVYIIRGIMLKGMPLTAMVPQVLFLLGISALFIGISIKKFKSSLE